MGLGFRIKPGALPHVPKSRGGGSGVGVKGAGLEVQGFKIKAPTPKRSSPSNLSPPSNLHPTSAVASNRSLNIQPQPLQTQNPKPKTQNPKPQRLFVAHLDPVQASGSLHGTALPPALGLRALLLPESFAPVFACVSEREEGGGVCGGGREREGEREKGKEGERAWECRVRL